MHALRTVALGIGLIVALLGTAACGTGSAGAGSAVGNTNYINDVTFGIGGDGSAGDGSTSDGASGDQDGTAANGADTGGDASAGDSSEGDASDGADTTNNPCPGAVGCPCSAASACDDGWCNETMAGKRCQNGCMDQCPAGLVCIQAPDGKDGAVTCVDPAARLCAPCGNDADCKHYGVDNGRCLAQADGSGRCGAACGQDDDCPQGYACNAATTVTGAKAQQCVPVDGDGNQVACSCSANAVAIATTSPCSGPLAGTEPPLTCPGTASCKSEGAAAKCSVAPPSKEACNGVDDDCDGDTDEQLCDDGDPCTIDSCAAAKQACIHTPAEQGSACSDDGQVCTNDICDGGTCSHPPVAGGTVCDADGSACTVADSCQQSACVAGPPLGCDDGNACTVDSCDAIAGCLHAPQAGLCPDDDLCTQDEVCVQGNCTKTAKTCDDSNACTDDLCDPKLGCIATAVAEGTACDEGKGACQQGMCKPLAKCGDGAVDQATEQCDDGNTTPGDGCDANCQIEAGVGCVKLGKDVRTLLQGPEDYQLGYCDSKYCEDKPAVIPAGWHIATDAEAAFLTKSVKFGSCAAWGIADPTTKKGKSYWYGGNPLSAGTTLTYTCSTGGCTAQAPYCYTQILLVRDGMDGTCLAP